MGWIWGEFWGWTLIFETASEIILEYLWRVDIIALINVWIVMARAFLAWFLTFYHTSITSRRHAFRIARKSGSTRRRAQAPWRIAPCLSSITTINVYENVVITVEVTANGWLITKRGQRVRHSSTSFVYNDFTSSWSKANACNSVFTTSEYLHIVLVT